MDKQRKPNVLTPADSLYPVADEPELVLVTPEMASDWSTARRWPGQRRISPNIVAKYLKDMREGRWKVTRQGLTFDTDGYQIDGAHRMRALANCDHDSLIKHYGEGGLYFWVYPNEPTDTFDAYDQNYKRTAAHLMHEPYSMALSAAARLLNAASDQDPWSFPRINKVSNPEVLSTKRAWPELSRYIAKVITINKPTHISQPEHSVVLAQAARSEHADRIESWLEGLHHGAGMENHDPRLKLRDRFMSGWVAMSGTTNRPLRYSLLIKAWNAHAEGRKLPVLRWAANEEIPSVVGFNWDEHKVTEESE